MLKSFFDVRQDSRDLFHDLDVMNDVEVISNWMNKFPVIYVTFKDIDGLHLQYFETSFPNSSFPTDLLQMKKIMDFLKIYWMEMLL